MGLYDGKKLLILGTSVSSVDIVKYAKSEGACVYVVDYLPPENSEAKKYADEHELISTIDVEAVYQYAKEKQIDGIFCGVSEANLLSVREVAERLGLPCYFTKEQWDILQDKSAFADLCEKYGLRTPKKYYDVDSNVLNEKEYDYPLVVKPVDCSSGIGVNICNTPEELTKRFKEAKAFSSSGRVIVEEFVGGSEFSAYYTAVNGEYKLTAFVEKYYNYSQTGELPLPEVILFPSKYTSEYILKEDEKVKEMVKSIGFKNGCFFFQGRYYNGRFVYFESGIRLAGLVPYRITSAVNRNNAMKMMTNFALTGEMGLYDLKDEDPFIKGKVGCNYLIMNGGGEIAKIEGLEEVLAMPQIIYSDIRKKVGDVVPRSGTGHQRQFMFFILCDSIEEMKKVIKTIQEKIMVLDKDGNNMLLRHFDIERLNN